MYCNPKIFRVKLFFFKYVFPLEQLITFFFLPLTLSPSAAGLDSGLNFQCLGPAQAPSLPCGGCINIKNKIQSEERLFIGLSYRFGFLNDLADTAFDTRMRQFGL